MVPRLSRVLASLESYPRVYVIQVWGPTTKIQLFTENLIFESPALFEEVRQGLSIHIC